MGSAPQITRQGRRYHPPHAVHANAANPQAAIGTGVIIVDGGANPSGISDEIAYLHFFRFLTKNSRAVSEAADEARRMSYLKYFFVTNCGTVGQQDRSLTDAEMIALLSYADKVGMEIADLEGAAVVAGGDPGLSSSVNSVVVSAIRGLGSALGPTAEQKVRSHVVEHMKTKIKIVRSDLPGANQ